MWLIAMVEKLHVEGLHCNVIFVESDASCQPTKTPSYKKLFFCMIKRCQYFVIHISVQRLRCGDLFWACDGISLDCQAYVCS